MEQIQFHSLLVMFVGLFVNFCDALNIAVEGNTGAGKTTLINILANEFAARIVDEPFEKWTDVNGKGNLFEQYQKDPPRWSVHLAVYSAVTKIDALKAAPRAGITLIDRSIYADRHAFAKKMLRDGTLSDEHFNSYDELLGCMLQEKSFADKFLVPYDRTSSLHQEIYARAFDKVAKPFHYKLDGIIYLRTSPEICRQRAEKRNRDLKDPNAGPEGSFYQELGLVHDEWLYTRTTVRIGNSDVSILTIDGDVDFLGNDHAKAKVIEDVKKFIGALSQR